MPVDKQARRTADAPAAALVSGLWLALRSRGVTSTYPHRALRRRRLRREQSAVAYQTYIIGRRARKGLASKMHGARPAAPCGTPHLAPFGAKALPLCSPAPFRAPAIATTLHARRHRFRAACYDPFTGHVLMAEAERDPAGWPRFCNVVRLDAANVVTEVIDSAAIRAYLQHYTSTTLAAAASATVASTDPGVAAAAAAAATAAANAGAGFTHILHMASDGQGNVYLVTGDEGRARCAILKLTLPDDWRAGVTSGASVPGAEGSRRSPQHATAHGKRPRHDTASSASTTTSTTSRASETAEVRVSMLLPAAPSTDITGLAWDARSESLLFSTPTAIYRLPQLSSPRGGAAAGGGGVSAATEHEEGEAGARAGGAADGGSAGSGSGNTGSGGAQGPSGAGGPAEGSRQLSQLREAGAAAATAAAAAAVAAVAAGSGVPVAALPSAAAVAAAAIAAIPQPPVMLLVAGKEGERAPASGPDGNPLATGTGTGGGTGGTGGTGDAGGTGGTASGGSEGREVNSSAPGGGDAGESGREGDASATPALDGRDEDEDEESPDTPPPEVAAADARFSAIGGVCVDADGNIYIIDNGSFYDRHIYKMSCCTNGLLPVVSRGLVFVGTGRVALRGCESPGEEQGWQCAGSGAASRPGGPVASPSWGRAITAQAWQTALTCSRPVNGTEPDTACQGHVSGSRVSCAVGAPRRLRLKRTPLP